MKIFCNSQGTKSRDPHVTKYNNRYYWTYVEANQIYIVESDSIEGFMEKEGVLVWIPGQEEYSKEVWAPELHIIDDICYIYVACDDGDNYHHRMYVLSNHCSEPLRTYQMLGKITDDTDKWAIDGTILRYKNGLYYVWSGWEGDENVAQNIYIAKLKTPTEIEGERVLLSTPEYEWEKKGGVGIPGERPFVNEGPYAFTVDERLFLAYSAGGSWCTDYSIAMMELVGDNPLEKDNWIKRSTPELSKNDAFVGMGHCSVIQEEQMIFFHGWKNGEEEIIANTVYPICSKYQLDNDRFRFI